ncbi:hypothetical protein F3J44_14875 [Pantoea sp. Tr-811]|uniref:hypothetical protein n=1 Tax=unclassified Pantoea TaxID=2630326 RepID=UPI00141F1E27|nr:MULTISPECIES: hypothetical protein [unclassified Pantoea]NIE73354.1 hypothetical protein [Pantoea sp. Ap-967]NIF27651.1 hypothetical protein [Pantoea sp. Tr-811]
MNIKLPRLLLTGLFALAAIGSAHANPMHTSNPALANPTAVQAPARAAENPWPSLASVADAQPTTLLAHDDRYWRDGRWHYRSEDRRREEWRRAQWRREQARREAERRRDWERHHRNAHYDDHRYHR